MVPAFPKNCFANGSRAFVLSFLERKAEPKTPRQLPGNSPTAPENSPTAPRKTPRQLPESTATTSDNFPGTFPQTAWKSLQICAASVFWPTGNVNMSGVSPLAYPSLSLQSMPILDQRWLIESVHSSLAHLYTFSPQCMLLLGPVLQGIRKGAINSRLVSRSACEALVRWVHYWQQRGHPLARMVGLLQSQINAKASRSTAFRKACMALPRTIAFGYD